MYLKFSIYSNRSKGTETYMPNDFISITNELHIFFPLNFFNRQNAQQNATQTDTSNTLFIYISYFK